MLLPNTKPISELDSPGRHQLNFKTKLDTYPQSVLKFFRILLIVMIMIFCFTSDSNAQFRIAQPFGNGMVLQREINIPVWGWGTAGDTVKVTFQSVSYTTVTDDSGRWQLELPPTPAGGPYTLSATSAGQTINRASVYVGDVWLASGQSNMEFAVSQTDSAAQVIAAANDQLIREFKVPKSSATEPQEELAGGSWSPATSAYVSNFSAVAYFFAKNLRQHVNIPIGILNISYGGSRIEAWMSKEMLGYDEEDTTMAAGETERQPTLLYNKMIHPVRNYAIKGVLWYQGESNADNMEDALAYSNNFKNFINSWRALWGLGDIPFLWVQLPNYGTPSDQPQTWDAWPVLRAAQSEALTLPNTGEAITIDVGGESLHPTYKQPVGYRLSLTGRKVAYGEDIVYSGPRYKTNRLRADGRIVINYDHPGSGLVARDSLAGQVGSFVVAGDDEQLVWAEAVIADDSVIVWNDAVPEPAIVRYAWEYNPSHANLYNAEGLPAAPFKVYVNPGFKIAYFRSARTVVEQGQSTTLSWLVFGASLITLDGVPVDSTGTQIIAPLQDTSYTLIAVNRENAAEQDTATVTITVLDPSQINRALNRPVTASTFEACCGDELVADFAVDGDMETRWSSAWKTEAPADSNLDDNPDDEWIAVEFTDIIDIERIILYWEAAYGSQYNLEVSYDGYLWKSVYAEQTGNGGEDNIVFETRPSGRFLRMHGLQRGTQYGFSLYELAVYGTLSAKNPPNVTVNTNLGNVLAVGTEVTITATTTDGDGEVVKAVFYVDGDSLGMDNEAPFELNWTPAEVKDHTLAAVVTDDSNLTVQSDPLIIYMDNGSITRFEAELAATTGQSSIVNNAATSGGKYRQLRDAWTITFKNISVQAGGEYLLTICYQLTYESPKSEYLVINGDTVGVVEFTAPNTSIWLQKGLLVQLREGSNEIALHGFWNWMSLDYIGVRGATIASVNSKDTMPLKHLLAQNFPNPFNPSTNIMYALPKRSHVLLEVYDLAGKKVTTLVNEMKAAGNHIFHYHARGLASGLYLYRLQTGDGFVQSKKFVILK
jgi:hypothetical protein